MHTQNKMMLSYRGIMMVHAYTLPCLMGGGSYDAVDTIDALYSD